MSELKPITERKKICGIYKITSPSGKIYIGQSIDIESRWKRYKYLSCDGQHKILRSLKKHGVDNHIFEIIEECSREMLNDREVYWGLFYNSTDEEHLNLVLGDKKTVISDATRKRMSEAHVGKKHSILQVESFKRNAIRRGKRISEGKTGKKLGPHSKEWNENLRKSNLNKQPMKTIHQFDKEGNFIKEWVGLIQTAKALGITKVKLYKAVHGKNGIKTCLGYVWKYKNQ